MSRNQPPTGCSCLLTSTPAEHDVACEFRHSPLSSRTLSPLLDPDHADRFTNPWKIALIGDAAMVPHRFVRSC